MVKILVLFLLFSLSGKLFSQQDSAVNYNTGYIFSIKYADTDSSENDIDEVKIYSVSGSDLNIGSFDDTVETRQNISVKDIKKIGYKSGKSSGKYTGIGVLTGLGVVVSIAAIANIGHKHGADDGYAALGYLIIGVSAPVIGGITGAVIGAYIDNYMEYDVAKFDSVISLKSRRIKLVIKEGMQFSH